MSAVSKTAAAPAPASPTCAGRSISSGSAGSLLLGGGSATAAAGFPAAPGGPSIAGGALTVMDRIDLIKVGMLIQEMGIVQTHQFTVTAQAIDSLIKRVEAYCAPFEATDCEFADKQCQHLWTLRAPQITEAVKQLRATLSAKTSPPLQSFIANGTVARIEMQRRWMSSPVQVRVGGNQCNLICEAPATLYCPAYAGLGRGNRVSMLGCYGQHYSFAFPLLRIRLHPDQLGNLPASVRTAIGNVSADKLDLLLVISNAKDVKKTKQADQRYNLVTHAWVYPDLQPNGAERKRDVSMGIFEGDGVYSVDSAEGIKFGKMGSLEVYAHSVNQAMAYSPNNAHFGVAPHASFSSFWNVVKCDDRTLAVQHVFVNDEENPFAKVIQTAAMKATNCDLYLGQLVTGLTTADVEITQTFGAIANQLKAGDESAMKTFDALDAQHKNWIYGEVWRLQGSPQNLHADFGRASFTHDASLPAQHHASADVRHDAVNNYVKQMKAQNAALLNNQMDLFKIPSRLSVATKEQKERQTLLTPIIAAFKAGQNEAGMKLFSALDDKHKGAIYGIVWNLKGCPNNIHPKFGEYAFIAHKDIDAKFHCTAQDKIAALNMYMYQ